MAAPEELETARSTPPSPGCYTPSEIERLGRERPDVFPSIWVELGFCFSLLGSMFVAEYFVSGFNVLLPVLSTALSIPPQAETWPASVFSLVTGAFLLPAGRLADIFGGYIVFSTGLAWFVVWSLIAGFSQNYIMLIFCRALQGFGPAAFLPSGIMLLGSIYRPGPRKNLVFSLYGAFAPIGFFAGIFFAGLAAQLLTWPWYFFLGTIFLAIVSLASFFCIPRHTMPPPKIPPKMDWPGTCTIVPGLLLLVFAITNGSHAPEGWATPYIPVTFVLGWVFVAAFVYVEGWVVEQPLLPGDMFRVKGMRALTGALFLQYGVFGIFLFYASFYIQSTLHATPLLTAAYFTPMCVGGLVLATIGGFVMHLIPGTYLLLISALSYTFSPLLFALLPSTPSSSSSSHIYWSHILPSTLLATLGVDITYNVSNIFITTSMPRARQGLAGAFINSVLFLGISVWLGVADLAVAEVRDREGGSEGGGYKAAFWMAVGLGGVAVVVLVGGGVRVGRAESGGWVEEKVEEMGVEGELEGRGGEGVVGEEEEEEEGARR